MVLMQNTFWLSTYSPKYHTLTAEDSTSYTIDVNDLAHHSLSPMTSSLDCSMKNWGELLPATCVCLANNAVPIRKMGRGTQGGTELRNQVAGVERGKAERREWNCEKYVFLLNWFYMFINMSLQTVIKPLKTGSTLAPYETVSFKNGFLTKFFWLWVSTSTGQGSCSSLRVYLSFSSIYALSTRD